MSASALTLLIFTSLNIFPQNPSSPAQTPAAQACTSSDDDTAIYSIAIRETLLKDDKGTISIVLLSKTSAGYPPGMAASTSFGGNARKDLMESTSADTKSDFDAKAKMHCDLTSKIEPIGKIVFLSAEQMNTLFSKGGESWENFQKQYPHAAGFTLISGIGFNTTHDQALVYVGNSCGGLYGAGYFILLAKKDGKWGVTKTANIWVS